MTSKRKAASNRTNAQRSSGPATVAGKMHASRNSRKHGLAVPITNDQTWGQRIESLASEIAGNDADPLRWEQARIIAEAELELTRVATARTRLLAFAGITPRDEPQPSRRKPRATGAPVEPEPDDRRSALDERGGFTGEELTTVLEQITLLDRYERRAFTRRNRAIRRFF